MNTQELEQLIRRLRVTGTAGLDVEVRVGVGKQVVETLSAMSNSRGGALIVGLSVRDGFARYRASLRNGRAINC